MIGIEWASAALGASVIVGLVVLVKIFSRNKTKNHIPTIKNLAEEAATDARNSYEKLDKLYKIIQQIDNA